MDIEKRKKTNLMIIKIFGAIFAILVVLIIIGSFMEDEPKGSNENAKIESGLEKNESEQVEIQKTIKEKYGNSFVEVTYTFDKNGKKNGPFIGYYDNGNKYIEGEYVDDKFFGEIISYHYEPETIMWKTNYDGGIKNGEEIWYYKNGQVKWKRNCVNGKAKGVQINYNEDGSIKGKKTW